MKKIYLILTLLIGVLHANFTFGQVYYPGGVSCGSAIPIPVGGTYNTLLDGAGSDHWYRFIAPCDGELTVSHEDVDYHAERRIYSGVCGSLFLESTADWSTPYANYAMNSGEEVYVVVNDTWDGQAQFDIEYTECPVIDSALLDVSGIVYYDLNANGIKDIGEIGKVSNTIHTDPFGLFGISSVTGYYYSSTSSLEDGIYQLYPAIEEYWRISTDSLSYTLNIGDGFVPRDSLDFGMTPDTIVHAVHADLVGGFPRCNDTMICWISVLNYGTTIASGLIDLELDDSLYFVSADIVPDSIVGQHIYWTYEGLFFDEYDLFSVQVGTPDGVADTVLSSVTITVVEDEEEMFSVTDYSQQWIRCAFDPNDKTPEPLGVGEFGYISPETESIEYLVRFQNTGTDTAINVLIKDQLDENLDWNSFELLSYSHDVELAMSVEGEISFIFNGIMLPDSNVNELASQGFVKYKINLLPGLPLETSIFNTAYIYFDLNPAVVTNTTINTLHIDNTSIDELANDQRLLVYPNPFTETTTVYFGEDLTNHSIQIVDPLGKLVYSNTTLTGKKVEIEASSLTEGMYILLLIDNESNQVISNAKLMVK